MRRGILRDVMDWVVAGTVLAGKYALERKLGQGGMGAVWRAEHVQLRSPVAIKLIDAQIVSNPEALARFMREAQSAAALRSPHVVQILDFGADRGVPYIAMELLDGESLADRLARVGRMPPAEVARLITQVARALGKAHEMGIVHRDIKPDNIYLVRNDEEEVAKVLDFGIAKQSNLGVGSHSATRTGAILGTPNYMSPEQAEGTKLVDHRTDLWALGVIVFECLVGRRPFDSDALGSLLLAICTRPIPVPSQWGYHHPGFDEWFARACSRELETRFQTARDLANELRRICGDAHGRDVSGSRQSASGAVHPAAGVTPGFGASPTPYGAPQTPFGAAQTPYGPAATHPTTPAHVGAPHHLATPAPLQPTGHTYAASVSMPGQRKPLAALVVGGLVVFGVLAAGVAFLVRSRGAEAVESPVSGTATSSLQATHPVAPPPTEPKPAEPKTTAAPVAAPAVTPSAEATPAESATKPPAPAAPRPRPGGARRPAAAKPAPVPAPAPVAPAVKPAPAPVAPAPQPAPEPKPSSPGKVNLGI